MNRGVLQSSVNPNWWNNMRTSTQHHQQPAAAAAAAAASSSQFLCPNSQNIIFQHYSNSGLNPFSLPSNWYDNSQDQLPESWSQLLLGGLVGELEDQKGCMGQFQAKKLLEDWEQEILNNNAHQLHDHVKKEHCVYGHRGSSGGGGGGEEFQLPPKQSWSPMIPASSSPQSCVTSFSSNMLDFSNNSPPDSRPRHPVPDRSSECNSNATGGAAKKARVQSSSNQTTFKVRKEKLGDRITALHQLVSPFGKTDTASVLLEAIGYIRFLQSQIEALSLPYLGNASSSTRQQQQQHQHSLLNENCLKRKGVSEQDEEPKKDLRSRGLCLVPVSCTLQVGSDNGADYWAPAFGGSGGFR